MVNEEVLAYDSQVGVIASCGDASIEGHPLSDKNTPSVSNEEKGDDMNGMISGEDDNGSDNVVMETDVMELPQRQVEGVVLSDQLGSDGDVLRSANTFNLPPLQVSTSTNIFNPLPLQVSDELLQEILLNRENGSFEVSEQNNSVMDGSVASSTENDSNIMRVSGDDGHDMDDDAGEDPDGAGAGMAIPVAIPAEPGFLARFSNRFNLMLKDKNLSFTEFEALISDFTATIKKELNFKDRSNDGAAPTPVKISKEYPVKLQKLYRKNRRKALRIIYDEESEFCHLDPEAVANHYATVKQDSPHSTEFM